MRNVVLDFSYVRKMWPNTFEKKKKWILVGSIGKVFDNWIKNLEFNLIGVLVWWQRVQSAKADVIGWN